MKLQVLVTVWLLVENISKNQAWWMKMPWKIEELSALAPLHNQVQLQGFVPLRAPPRYYKCCCFDTAFHTSMPKWPTVIQCLIVTIQTTKSVEYGAHGTSHQYVSQEAAKLLGKPIEETK